jgi:rhamnosyltransferase
VGRDTTRFSEQQLFEKYFPEYSKPDQDGYFCNNANAAVLKSTWEKFGYNEELTGLEDMYLARRIYEAGGKIWYVASAPVYHIHDETWSQVRVRYEREAVALQRIMPNVHFTLVDFVLFLLLALGSDMHVALKHRCFWRHAGGILMFRSMQYWGTYMGSKRHRLLSASIKRSYFYPKDVERQHYVGNQKRSFVAHEGQQ